MSDTTIAPIVAMLFAAILLAWFGLLSWLLSVTTYDICVIIAYYLYYGSMHIDPEVEVG